MFKRYVIIFSPVSPKFDIGVIALDVTCTKCVFVKNGEQEKLQFGQKVD